MRAQHLTKWKQTILTVQVAMTLWRLADAMKSHIQKILIDARCETNLCRWSRPWLNDCEPFIDDGA